MVLLLQKLILYKSKECEWWNNCFLHVYNSWRWNGSFIGL